MLLRVLSLGRPVASAGRVVPNALRILGSQGLCSSYSTNTQPSEPVELRISEDLLSKVKEKDLLRAFGFIGGKWSKASNRATYQVTNPATGKHLATMPKMKADETLTAIAAAHAVFPKWSHMTAKERGKILRRWYELILEHADDLAVIMTAECGKPLAEAKSEIASGAASVEWFAEECKRVNGDLLETLDRNKRMIVLKQPVGVVAAITPWNFPMSMITRKVTPALAAGCTVVLKPAELTPLTALALTELADRAGLPDGAFNVVLGDAASIGQAMCKSETVRKIGFTGSTAVGKMLMEQAAKTVKRVSLELGGNAPFIVFDDADLEAAAAGVVTSALRNSGQTCICANRVFVQDKVYDKFAELVAAKVGALKLGDGMTPDTTHGPLITPAGVDKVTNHVSDAVSKGAKVLVGGEKPQLPDPLSGGNFFSPTVLAEATIDMRCFREETFGPLVPLFRFREDDEVVLMANDTEYGLAAYFYTTDLHRAWTIAEQLEYGMIGLNEVAITNEVAPFGGMKQSGLGREQGKYGLEEFLETKYVCMGLNYAS
eukprot:GHRR01002539.1.p1 GENE.GHRR01002539.1~~GHRR01002539.1.p1  ORF type:complete len:546 (+),score=169.25 GHRR01002539.1:2001-3638(+)